MTQLTVNSGRPDQTNHAGLRLLAAQEKGKTNLCIGLDPHCLNDPQLQEIYVSCSNPSAAVFFETMIAELSKWQVMKSGCGCEQSKKLPQLLCGVTNYFLSVVECSWQSSLRVFKPQAAFYEQFGLFGPIIMGLICQRIHELGRKSGEPYFIIMDVKRGDIDKTQGASYATYLTPDSECLLSGMPGPFGANAMTVTTWMGLDVLTAGLPWFKKGKGAVVVTRSSNPSGTALQDLMVMNNDKLSPTEKQRPFVLTPDILCAIRGHIHRIHPTAAEVMLFLTEQFSRNNGLNAPMSDSPGLGEGISPIMSVIGSTVRDDGTFRLIRPSGIALVPGFGAQNGEFANSMPLLWTDGPFAGQGAIFSSSRGHNFPWDKKNGGSDDPKNLESDLEKAINAFRAAEKQAYADADVPNPYL